MLRRVPGPKTQEITRYWRKVCIGKLLGLYASQTVKAEEKEVGVMEETFSMRG